MKALIVATVASFVASFELNDIAILQDMGYEVHCAANYKDGTVEKLENFKGKNIKTHQIDFARSPFSKTNLTAFRQLKKLMEKEKFDLVHCHTPMGGFLARLTAEKYRKSGTKVIYTAHGFHFFKGAPIKNWLIYYPVEKVCSYMTDVLITINKEDFALAKKKMHAKVVKYIPGVGVDLDKFRTVDVNKEKIKKELGIPVNGFLLLSVGELSSRKNHQIVMKALAELNCPDIYYCIAGIGPDYDCYKQMIQSNHLENNVYLLGHRTDITALCFAADCFVHPSVREGLGIAPLEGMACGLPLISSYVNGIKDYTEDGVSGCCVNPLDCGEMIRAIEKMYRDKTFREKCGQSNVETVKNFDLNKSQEIMKKIYNENMGGVLKYITERNALRRELGCSAKDIILISVGEINANKNHKIIIEAMSRMNDRNIRYWICGIGDKKSELETLADKLGLKQRVFFLGFQTDITKYLLAADIFCFPSKREGLGIAAIEAMACGLPLITSNIHGINDYSVQGVSGYSCRPDCIDDFLKAIRKLGNDKPLRTEMGIRNYKFSERYSIEQVMPIMKSIYRAVLDDNS